MRKTNYRQQKKSREDARKARNNEKKERRQGSTEKGIEVNVTPNPDVKVVGPSD